MERPPMRVAGPVLDAADPVGLARFYERLLGWEMVEREGPRPRYRSHHGGALLPADSEALIHRVPFLTSLPAVFSRW